MRCRWRRHFRRVALSRLRYRDSDARARQSGRVFDAVVDHRDAAAFFQFAHGGELRGRR